MNFHEVDFSTYTVDPSKFYGNMAPGAIRPMDILPAVKRSEVDVYGLRDPSIYIKSYHPYAVTPDDEDGYEGLCSVNSRFQILTQTIDEKYERELDYRVLFSSESIQAEREAVHGLLQRCSPSESDTVLFELNNYEYLYSPEISFQSGKLHIAACTNRGRSTVMVNSFGEIKAFDEESRRTVIPREYVLIQEEDNEASHRIIYNIGPPIFLTLNSGEEKSIQIFTDVYYRPQAFCAITEEIEEQMGNRMWDDRFLDRFINAYTRVVFSDNFV